MFVYFPRRLKALNFDNFKNSHNSFLWQEYFIDFFYVKDGLDPCQASTSVLCLHYRTETVHCGKKDAYVLFKKKLSLHYNLAWNYFLSPFHLCNINLRQTFSWTSCQLSQTILGRLHFSCLVVPSVPRLYNKVAYSLCDVRKMSFSLAYM